MEPPATWQRSRLCCICQWRDSHGVAEGFELADGAGLGFRGLALRLVFRAEFAVERTVGEHVPRGDDEGMLDGDESAHRSAPGFDPLVFGGEERVLRAGCRHRRNPKRTFEIRITGACLRRFYRGQQIRWSQVRLLAQDAKWPALGNTLISRPVSAMNTSAVLLENPGMLIKSSRVRRKGAIAFDACIEAADVGGVGIDAVEEQPGHERVMGTEPPGERFGQLRDLAAQRAFGKVGDHAGIILAAMRASSIARPDTPVMSVATEDSLIPASSSSFSSRCTSRERSRVMWVRARSYPAAPGSVAAERTTPSPTRGLRDRPAKPHPRRRSCDRVRCAPVRR